MSITSTTQGNITILALQGVLNEEGANFLRLEIDKLIDRGAFLLVIDFSAVTSVLSAGFVLLLATRKVVKRWQQGDLHLACLSNQLKNQFSLIGFDRIFDFYETVEEAVQGFRPKALVW